MRLWGSFWYSEKQYWAHFQLGEQKAYARIVLGPRVGRVVMYTEMVPIRSLRDLFKARPFGSWDDYRWLGVGWFERIEGN